MFYAPDSCAALPDVRVHVKGETLEIDITGPTEQKPCAPNQLVLIELDTRRDFLGFTVKR